VRATLSVFLLLFGPVQLLFAQAGGKRSFEFLNVPGSARQAALGGVNVSLADRDVNFLYSNPALVSDTLAGMAAASYQFYIADIGQATFSYAHDFGSIGTMAFGVQHLGYGTIKGYDDGGQETGDFKADETALVISKSHRISAFRLGASLKGVFSNMAGYRASALALDVGGVFVHPQKNFTVGLAIKNLGVVLSDYSGTSNSKLPFDVQVGTTFKPEHMPLRFSITAYRLAQSGNTYYDAQSGEEEPGVLNKVLRRFNFGTEILLHRNVNVMVAYNYATHQELKLVNGGGGAGISFGLSARIKAVEIVMSRGGYVAGKAGYAFTLAVNADKLIRRRQI
jgi:hypothetical protein